LTTLALAGAAIASFAASVSAAPAVGPDLKIAKSASVSSVTVGEPLTYTILVENLGPETATGVTVTDPLAKGSEYLSASATLGSCGLQGQRVVCLIGSLEGDPAAKVNSSTITLQVRPQETGSLINTASVKADRKDPVAGNDSASVTTTVLTASPQAPSATCLGVPATIVGTGGPDALVGTGGRDVIVAAGGNDTIYSLAGRDLICAGTGNDRVVGGSAADRILGNAGRDTLLGRGGPDLLKGGAGPDTLGGNAGADRLHGGGGFDRCRPGPGHDSVRSCER
jgi:uncharacterized repeat protein (TIGR01451 family)